MPGLYFCGSLAMFHPRGAFIHGFRNYVEKVFRVIAVRFRGHPNPDRRY